MYKLTAVSYLNTKPFLYGLLSSPLIQFLDISLNIPSVCANEIKSGNADIGLIPVAILNELEAYHIISDYCIGSIGPVSTVCVFAEKPLEELRFIYLDYHSRTSVELLKILLREYWKIDVELVPADQGFTSKIKGDIGGLVIGDRTIPLLNKFKYQYDLGEIWDKHTGGLPFVYAVWVSKNELDPVLLQIFNAALKSGLERIDDLIKILPSPETGFDLKKYFTDDLSYDLDESKRKSIDLFLQKILINS